MGNKIYQGTKGLKLKANCNRTVVGATGTKEIRYIKPDNTTGAWSAIAETTIYLSYTTTSTGELDTIGTWKLNSYVEDGSYSGHGETYEFSVYRKGQ